MIVFGAQRPVDHVSGTVGVVVSAACYEIVMPAVFDRVHNPAAMFNETVMVDGKNVSRCHFIEHMCDG